RPAESREPAAPLPDHLFGAQSALEIGLAVTGEALIYAGRIEYGQIEFNGIADPPARAGVIGEIVQSQRMDQNAKARLREHRLNGRQHAFREMDFELRNDVRPDFVVAQLAHKQNARKRIADWRRA